MLFFVGFQFGNVGLGLGRDNHQLGIFVFDGFAHLFDVCVACSGGSIIHVADVEHGFGGEEEHLLGAGFLVFVLRHDGAGAEALFQGFLVAQQEAVLGLCLFVATDLCLFLDALDAVLYSL